MVASSVSRMTNAPIILVPGFWLGAWAWDGVADLLRADGHDVTALTLPGLEPDHPDRASVSARRPGQGDRRRRPGGGPAGRAGRPLRRRRAGYAATDLAPEAVAAMVYVDTGPANGPLDADFDGAEHPLPAWDDLDENLDGISEEQLAEFRERAVPEPGNVMRDAHTFTNDARWSDPDDGDLHGLHLRGVQGGAARRATPSSAGTPSSTTSPGSTCRRPTGRCGPSRASWPRSSARSRHERGCLTRSAA